MTTTTLTHTPSIIKPIPVPSANVYRNYHKMLGECFRWYVVDIEEESKACLCLSCGHRQVGLFDSTKEECDKCGAHDVWGITALIYHLPTIGGRSAWNE